jgi:Tfp pilus assembly protein PilP
MRVKSSYTLKRLTRQPLLLALALALAGGTAACGEKQASSRGVPGADKGKGKGKDKDKDKGKGEGKGGDKAGPAEPERPARPKIILTREDFSELARDPFQGFLPIDDEVPGETAIAATKSRDVKMAGYAFEDLNLIGIVRSGKNVQPRALFVSNDGKSKTIRQGEYFSRAEVLLASVNRDYVEIEVVDEEKARGMNWQVGERRAIYLKNE